ncbi:MAG: single-stranded DNA-binding protein [Alphaproteobacteria bacterium]
MNAIEIAMTGRIGRDPELKHVKGGTLALLALAIAADDGAKGEDAPTTWVRVTVFGDRAEALAPTLAKGDRTYVEGKLSLDHWTGKDGTAMTGLSVVASLVQPLGKIGNRRPKQERVGRSSNESRRQNSHSQVDSTMNPMPFDDDLSF